MKTIIIGCSHFGLVYKGINFNERIHDCFLQIYNRAMEIEPDLVVLLGDLFHNMGYSIDAVIQVVHWLRQFDNLGCEVIVVQGNHDKKKFRNDSSDVFDLVEEFRFDNVDLRRGRISFKAYKKLKVALLFIPYLDKNDLSEDETNVQERIEAVSEETLQRIKSKWSSFKVYVFSHLSVEGVKTGSEVELTSSRDLVVPKCLIKSKMVKRIFNGHIHLRQEVGKVIMPGSVESFRFGEGKEKFFLEVEL